MLFAARSIRSVLFVLLVTLASRPVQGQTSPFELLDKTVPSANPQADDPTARIQEEAAKLQETRSKYPKVKSIDLKRPALTESQLQPNAKDDEVMQIAKQKAITLRELLKVYRDHLSQSASFLPQQLNEVAKAEQEYAAIAFEILKSEDDKLNALNHSLNAAIYLENMTADRMAAGGPIAEYLGAKAQRLEAQLRVAKFKRTMSVSPNSQIRP